MIRLSILILTLTLLACSNPPDSGSIREGENETALYSSTGEERRVSFQAWLRTSHQRIEDAKADLEDIRHHELPETVKFIFGPLTHQEIAGPQKDEELRLSIEQAILHEGRVLIPYHYSGTWLIRRDLSRSGALELALPYNQSELETRKWKKCTDSAPEHQTWDFFWYYWDPKRSGCDHVEGLHYQKVQVRLGEAVPMTRMSTPEYRRMIRMKNGEPVLEMTFGFGYIEDPARPDPFRDRDYGMVEFRRFHEEMDSRLTAEGFTRTPILQSHYPHHQGNVAIGSRFTGMKNGTRVSVTVVAAAGVDQMEIFAKSYAGDDEGFFAWFGHSRVGSGFDAAKFRSIVDANPEVYAIRTGYQLIYWAGCNSYSYYTLPFFQMKAALDRRRDPAGTRNLDIISNGLPSLFAYNAANASILAQALLNWESPTSYQKIVDDLENYANRRGVHVLVNVLGDEDNP